MVSALGQGIAALGAAFTAASIFMNRGGTYEFLKKAMSRGMFIIAIGLLMQLLATISLIIIPPVSG